MKTKVIATGISGLVGSRIVELLGNKFEFISFSLDTGVDITNEKLLEDKFGEYSLAPIVLHLAAYTDVDGAFKQNEQINGSCYKVNVIGSKNIAHLCKKLNKYLIHISTDFVFDGKTPPNNGYLETDLPKPLEWYGKTKLLAEQEVQNSGCESAIVRIAFPFKAKNAPSNLEPIIKLDFVRKIIEKLKNNENLSMFTDQLITPTFIDNIAQSISKIIELKPKGIFHCVGSTFISPYDLALKICEYFNLNRLLIKPSLLVNYQKENSLNRPRPFKSILSNQKIQQELGVKMLSVDEALQEMEKQIS